MSSAPVPEINNDQSLNRLNRLENVHLFKDILSMRSTVQAYIDIETKRITYFKSVSVLLIYKFLILPSPSFIQVGYDVEVYGYRSKNGVLLCPYIAGALQK